MWLQVPADEVPANILILFLPPNTTSHLQTCGKGIIAALKAFSRQLYCQGLLTWLEAHPTSESRIVTTSTDRQKTQLCQQFHSVISKTYKAL